MRPAASYCDFFDRPTAFSAGLAAVAVDFQVGNEAAARPVAPSVIARRGATLGNGQAENFFDRAAEFLNFRQPQSFEPPGRAPARGGAKTQKPKKKQNKHKNENKKKIFFF